MILKFFIVSSQRFSSLLTTRFVIVEMWLFCLDLVSEKFDWIDTKLNPRSFESFLMNHICHVS